MSSNKPRIALFCGGVGGARMAAGFAALMPPEDLSILVNVGDDFRFCGLAISPDLDTVMYTLAGLNDEQRGWGLRDETWTASRRTAELGGPAWFQLGDHDIGTHFTRTALLEEGRTLSEVTRHLCDALKLRAALSPVTDAPLRTQVRTPLGLLDFQDYFVRHRAVPEASEILYQGAGEAPLSAAARAALDDPALSAIVFAPSNPVLSLEPMLAVQGMRAAIARARARGVPVIAVSPILGGEAVKGPAAKLLRELGHEVSAWGVAKYYEGLVSHFLIDTRDAALTARIQALGMQVVCTDIMIPRLPEQQRLAAELLAVVGR